MGINPYKLALLLTASRDKAFLVKSIQAYSRHCTLKSMVYIYIYEADGCLIEISAPNYPGTHAITNFFTCKQIILGSYSDPSNSTSKYSDLLSGRKCLPSHSLEIWDYKYEGAVFSALRMFSNDDTTIILTLNDLQDT